MIENAYFLLGWLQRWFGLLFYPSSGMVILTESPLPSVSFMNVDHKSKAPGIQATSFEFSLEYSHKISEFSSVSNLTITSSNVTDNNIYFLSGVDICLLAQPRVVPYQNI